MRRHISVTLDYDGNYPASLTAADVRDLIVEHYEALREYHGADVFVTVSGE